MSRIPQVQQIVETLTRTLKWSKSSSCSSNSRTDYDTLHNDWFLRVTKKPSGVPCSNSRFCISKSCTLLYFLIHKSVQQVVMELSCVWDGPKLASPKIYWVSRRHDRFEIPRIEVVCASVHVHNLKPSGDNKHEKAVYERAILLYMHGITSTLVFYSLSLSL